MEQGWVKVYSTDEKHLAHIVEEMLGSNDIEVVLMDKKDSANLIAGEVELYVKHENVLRTLNLINKANE